MDALTTPLQEAPPAPQRSRRFGSLSTAIVLGLAAIKLLGTMAVDGRYGFHRDELYYLACARHLSLGYVDFPPVTPLLGRLETLVLGTSVSTLRFLPALVGAIIVLLAALMAGDMGGGKVAQILAAIAVLLSPLYLATNLLFQTVTFDQIAWLATLYLLLQLVRTGDHRLWVPIGIALGIGLETKYLIVALGIGIAAGLLLTPARAQLRTPWPWLAAGIAALILVPNLIWQVQHDWASLTYTHHHQGVIAGSSSRLGFLLEVALFLGPIGLPLAVLGVRHLFSRAQLRLLGWTCVIAALVIFVSGGKSYYVGPLFAFVLAAGSVGIEGAVRRRPRTAATIVGVLVLITLPLVPLGLPILPARTANSMGLMEMRQDYRDMIGWPEMASQVAHVYHSLPPSQRRHATVWAINYGEAGALDLYGPRLGLPTAISSHLTYYYWKPRHVDDRTVIVVGAPRSMLTPIFADIRQAGRLSNSLGVHNEEVGRAIYICRHPLRSLDSAWPSLQFWD